MQDHIRWFETLRVSDVGLVGGKTASLGELYGVLGRAEEIAVPNGFGITADAYRSALDGAEAWTHLAPLLDKIDRADTRALSRRAAAARAIVYKATGTAELRAQVREAYALLERQYGSRVSVAVRSSATAEDLPEASFAGQHDSFVNVRGADAVFEACRKCFASIFTDRAIVYRNNHGFDHAKVALSVAVMKMVRTDKGASGVTFTLDPESGFRDVVLVSGIYGLGENIVQGQVNPDEFFVHKPTFESGHRVVLRHILGEKQLRMTFARGRGATTVNRSVPIAMRRRFCLSDDEVLALAGQAIAIEKHYSAINGRPTPMDIEWAKDGVDSQLYIVQARPETVASQRPIGQILTYSLQTRTAPIASGRAVGEKVATGKARLIRSAKDLRKFRAGEILITDATTPDWQPIMKMAAGIITDRGGPTCHAAIVARELGIPAVVGTKNATGKVKNGSTVTLACCQGEIGHVYAGKLPFGVDETKLSDLPRPKTQIMVNLGDPDLAFRTAMLPNDGVGLARMEFIINEFIGIHPMALADMKKVAKGERHKIESLTRGFPRPEDFFVQRLSEGVGTIAAAFFPKPVIVRLSDFKTNEYARLLGGAAFEPVESNPMIGFRGASRYAHPAYAAGFALECKALARVRREMGLTNLKIMVPFCRREDEARGVLKAMAHHGLRRGKDGLEIFVMCEIPNNVIRIDAFAELFDGFSIGSNDLTQLTLGVDRDSEIVAFDFDERDPGMVDMLRLAVEGARRNRRHVGICGEAPANHPETARELVAWGIDSISVNPASLIKCFNVVAAAEKAGRSRGKGRRSARGNRQL